MAMRMNSTMCQGEDKNLDNEDIGEGMDGHMEMMTPVKWLLTDCDNNRGG